MDRLIRDFLDRGMTLRETHVSCVFFTAERVYKVKKPVALGFLDFTSLAARKHFCEQEVELNRRLAPDVYLRAVPIVRDENGVHRIGSIGEKGLARFEVHMTQPKKRVRPSSLVVWHDILLRRELCPDGRSKVVATTECDRHQGRFDVNTCRSCERFTRIEMHEAGFVVLCRSRDETFDEDE